MPVWWRYQDIVDVVGEARAIALEKELLRGLSSGAISASADLVIYSTEKEMIREEMIVLPPSVFREQQVIMSGKKRAKFNPSIGKYFNPRCPPPEGRPITFDTWAVDCFGLAYRGHELIKELDLPVSAETKPETSQAPVKRGGGRHPSVEGWSRFAAALAVWVHKRNDEALGIASVGPDELLAEMDHIAMNELPRSLSGDLPRGTYQAGAAAVLEAFSHLARK